MHSSNADGNGSKQYFQSAGLGSNPRLIIFTTFLVQACLGLCTNLNVKISSRSFEQRDLISVAFGRKSRTGIQTQHTKCEMQNNDHMCSELIRVPIDLQVQENVALDSHSTKAADAKISWL